MKALTLWQPWSWAIAHAGKRVENRTWAPPASVIGQRVAMHAGLRLDKSAVKALCFESKTANAHGLDMLAQAGGLARGAVESVATLLGYVMRDGEAVWRKADGSLVEDDCDKHLRFHDARRSKWWIGPIGWVLADVTPLPKPVPCKGAQGLWTLPEDVESAVLAQLTRAA